MHFVEDFNKEDILKYGYSYYSTVMAFGLNESQMTMLKECVNNFNTYDKVAKMKKEIRIYVTDEVTDIYAIPYFIAFINSEFISEEEMQGLMDFWRESAEPLQAELLNEGYLETDFANSINYLFNCGISITSKIQGVNINKDIFSNKERLRLTILSEIKNNEGLGRASESSIRIWRVLLMYKCLLREGSLTKRRIDEICYPDVVSKRMFYKDIRLISDIEDGKVVFDRNRKAYVLKK